MNDIRLTPAAKVRDSSLSYCDGRPLRERRDLPFAIDCLPRDEAGYARIADRWWATSCPNSEKFALEQCCKTVAEARLLLAMRDRILRVAGDQVCMPWGEMHATQIFAFGEAWPAMDRILIQGRIRECHKNCLRLWKRGAIDGVATGYALDSRGMWTQHT